VIRSVAVGSPAGLHARAAALVAAAAAAQSLPVTVRVGDRPAVPADSVLSLLSLGATAGTELILEAEGPDAASALEALADLISAGPDRATFDAAAPDAAGPDAALREAAGRG
jgi:phosphocarrier protein HPr